MKTRHDNYEDLGKNFKVMLDNSKLGTPDMAAVSGAAAVKVNEYAGQMGTWFPPGTGPEAGKTKAKANVWTERADFDAKLADLQTEAAKLVTATSRMQRPSRPSLARRAASARPATTSIVRKTKISKRGDK